MKKTIFTIAIITLLCSCQKEDKNGDLGGFWKLMSITTQNDGITQNTKQDSRFWAIQLKLIQINNHLGRFQHKGDSLLIQMIDQSGDKLKEYGLFRAEDERFKIEHLDRNSMTLQSEYAKLRLKKF